LVLIVPLGKLGRFEKAGDFFSSNLSITISSLILGVTQSAKKNINKAYNNKCNNAKRYTDLENLTSVVRWFGFSLEPIFYIAPAASKK